MMLLYQGQGSPLFAFKHVHDIHVITIIPKLSNLRFIVPTNLNCPLVLIYSIPTVYRGVRQNRDLMKMVTVKQSE